MPPRNRLTNRDRAEAAAVLRRVLEKVDGSELVGPAGMVRRLEGAAAVLEVESRGARRRLRLPYS
jgi:hypothetical protein